ncbi:transporter substrate-binding domain-containing protein [Microbacterium oleivorans]|uniref:transporter substrate-binding domain-containing protein n=1 Tax=Microbacterium oleivorans TaxID=273677 RepID=UPI0007674A84|nr:transporter substrate-binding domain-containing protein [Microbacterium oleivorans]
MFHRARAAIAASLIVGLGLAGCGVRPADVDGTLATVEDSGVLRAGVSENPPWSSISGAEPTGSEVTLIERFAARHGAEVEWRAGTEEVLVDALHAGSLDVVVGGLTDATPWLDDAAVSDVYTEVVSPTGETEKHVMLTRAGENGLLMELETFLREEVDG